MRAFKTIVSVSFLIFLFLPLSQCSRSLPEPIEEGTTELIDKVKVTEGKKFIPVKEFDSDYDGFFVLITFLMPLFTCLLRPQIRGLVITNNAIQILSSVWLGFVVFIWVYAFNSPLLSGHILFTLIGVFLVSSLYTTFHSIKNYYNNIYNDVIKRTEHSI